MDWGIDSVCDRNIQIRAWGSRTVDKTKSSKILPTDAAPQFLKKLTPLFSIDIGTIMFQHYRVVLREDLVDCKLHIGA